MKISVNSTVRFNYSRYVNKIKKITSKTFRKLGIKNNYLIELNFISNIEIQKLNSTYRKINKETDVLSFAFLELKKKEIQIRSNKIQILGEIDISIDKIKTQSKELNHTFQYELIYIYLHGLLHLLGYDHVKSKYAEKKMFDLEDEILKGENI